MAKRHSKTVAQQCRYYEVDNIFEYMVEVCINGNFSSFRRLYHELNKEARKDFIAFLILECPPQKPCGGRSPRLSAGACLLPCVRIWKGLPDFGKAFGCFHAVFLSFNQ